MGKKRYTAEQIIRKLREAEVLLGMGMTLPQAVTGHFKTGHSGSL